MINEQPETLIEAVRYFSDRKVCFDAMLAVKWPEGKICCPKCGGESIGVVRSRSVLQCKAADCRKQFSVKVGTIFEDSPLGLDKWFVAVWCIANAKNGISSCELARALGVTQKTAWFMLHRVRRRSGIHGDRMTRKPDGLPEFERLLKPLAQVPKKELDKKAAEYEARKKAKQRKK